jgi:hypothetical protein
MTFPVTLSFASTYPIYVDYATAGGNALAGTNYTAESGTLTFAPGETLQDVVVPILPGTSSGGYVNFYLEMTNPSYAVGAGDAQGTIYLGPYVESITSSLSPRRSRSRADPSQSTATTSSAPLKRRRG